MPFRHLETIICTNFKGSPTDDITMKFQKYTKTFISKVQTPENFLQEITEVLSSPQWVNPLRPRQNGRHFADNILNLIFLNENIRTAIKI